MKNIYKKTTYNIDIAECLDDDVRKAWEEGRQYHCIEVYSDEAAEAQSDKEASRVGFIMFELGVVRKIAILVYEYVETDYRDKQIGSTILSDSCNKLYELGYKGVYASIKGHDEDIESKRYFLDSQGFTQATTIQMLTYLRENIVRSEWYRSFVDNDALQSVIVDVNKESKNNDIIHMLAKEGIILSENVLIKTIVKDGKMFGAVLYGIENDNLIIYDVNVFEKTKVKELFCALVIGVFTELEKMDEKINLVRVCTNDSFEMDMLLKNLGEPYDFELRQEWLLRLEE